jgi:hypothetical protein
MFFSKITFNAFSAADTIRINLAWFARLAGIAEIIFFFLRADAVFALALEITFRIGNTAFTGLLRLGIQDNRTQNQRCDKRQKQYFFHMTSPT